MTHGCHSLYKIHDTISVYVSHKIGSDHLPLRPTSQYRVALSHCLTHSKTQNYLATTSLLFALLVRSDKNGSTTGTIVIWILLESLNDVLGDGHKTVINVAVQLGGSLEELDSIFGRQSFALFWRNFLLIYGSWLKKMMHFQSRKLTLSAASTSDLFPIKILLTFSAAF